jgi:hypothetical protein
MFYKEVFHTEYSQLIPSPWTDMKLSQDSQQSYQRREESLF